MNMIKKLTMTALVSVAFLGTAACSSTSPASARESFVFGFDSGSVAFAYSDGYWDHNRRWHSWHSPREAHAFRSRYPDRYTHRGHRHYPNAGWRDSDRDGVANRYDRDRDGDGVPNRRDRRPENPYRR